MEGQDLAWLAQVYVRTTAVEIGSCEGRSACYILDALADLRREAVLHCVDLWELGQGSTPPKHSTPKAYARFKKNLTALKLWEHAVPHKGLSSDIAAEWGSQIDMLFIDGSHQYEYVRQDYEMWSPFVRIGGVLAFHDANQEDVGRVILELPIERWARLPLSGGRIAAYTRRGTP